jgi:hypothetical protein
MEWNGQDAEIPGKTADPGDRPLDKGTPVKRDVEV